VASVEEIRIESDERGFELHIVVGDDIDVDDQGRAILNVQAVAEELYDAVKASIGPWLAERDNAYREWQASRAAGELDDGYELDDPKHPTFYERYAGAADDARKTRREGGG
jgi:hypothetical protein